jgi:uncharacterized protein (TIGR00252 family)
MSTTATGRNAEELVAAHLSLEGHSIIAMNWRTRWCEIDIVSTKKKTVYFTEVKFRSSGIWGGGFDYITPRKLKQMKFAAEFWLTDNKWKGPAALLAAEVTLSGDITIVEI